jgi:hypothetical protein
LFDSFEGGGLINTSIDDGIDTENVKSAKEIKYTQYKSTVAIFFSQFALAPFIFS